MSRRFPEYASKTSASRTAASCPPCRSGRPCAGIPPAVRAVLEEQLLVPFSLILGPCCMCRLGVPLNFSPVIMSTICSRSFIN